MTVILTRRKVDSLSDEIVHLYGASTCDDSEVPISGLVTIGGVLQKSLLLSSFDIVFQTVRAATWNALRVSYKRVWNGK